MTTRDWVKDATTPLAKASDLLAFTDGGCRGNPGGIGAWAFVLIDRETRVAVECAQAVDETTNNRMEMEAAIHAMTALPRDNSRVLLFSDSKYLINCCTLWMEGWKAKGWRRKKQPLKNLDLLKELDRLQGAHDVAWEWVAGHSGHAGNDRVDELANTAMDALERGEPGRWVRETTWRGRLG